MRLRFLDVDYYGEKPKEFWEEQEKFLPPIPKDDSSATMLLSPLHFSATNARAGLFDGRNVHEEVMQPEKRSLFLSSSTCLPVERCQSEVPSREESLSDKNADAFCCARSQLRNVSLGHLDAVEASIDETHSINLEKDADLVGEHWSPLSCRLQGDGWQELKANGYNAAPDGPRTMKTSDLKVSFGMLENVAPSAVLKTPVKNHHAAASQLPAVPSGAACDSQTYDGVGFLVSECFPGQVDADALSEPKLSGLTNAGKIKQAVKSKTNEESVQVQLAVDEPFCLLSDWLQEGDSSEDLRVHGRLLGSTADTTPVPDLEGSELDVASVEQTGVLQNKPQRDEDCAPVTSDGTLNNKALAFVGAPVVGGVGYSERNEAQGSCLKHIDLDQMKSRRNVRKEQGTSVQYESCVTNVVGEDAVLVKEVAGLTCLNHDMNQLSEKDVHTEDIKVLKDRNLVPVATCVSNSIDFEDDLNGRICRQSIDGLAPAQEGNEPDVATALGMQDDPGGGDSTFSELNQNTASVQLADHRVWACSDGAEPVCDVHCNLNNLVEVQQPEVRSLLVPHCGAENLLSIDQCGVPGMIYLHEAVENTQVEIDRSYYGGISREPDERKIQLLEGETNVVDNLSGFKTLSAPSALDIVKNHTIELITNSRDGVHCKRTRIRPQFNVEEEATMVSPGTPEGLQPTCMSQELAFFVEARRGNLETSSGSAQHHKIPEEHTCNRTVSGANSNHKPTGRCAQVNWSTPEIPDIEGSYHEHEVTVPSPIADIVCCLQSEYTKILEASDEIIRRSNGGCRVPTRLTGDPNLLAAILCDVKEATSRREPPQVLQALLCILVLQQTSRILCSQGARVAYHYIESMASNQVELSQLEEHPKLIILKNILQGRFGADMKSNPNRPEPKALILAERRVFFTLHSCLHSLRLKALEVDTEEALLQHGNLIQDKTEHLNLETQQALSSFDCVLLPYTYLNSNFPLAIFSVIIQYDEIPFSLETRSEVGRFLSRAPCCRHLLKVAQVHPAKEVLNRNSIQQTRQASTSRTCSTTTTERPLRDPHGTRHLETLSACQKGRISESPGTTISPLGVAAQSQNHSARSLAAPMKSSQRTFQTTAKCIDNTQMGVFRQCEMILIINSGRTSDWLIRSLCQRIATQEDENLQVVEREMAIPVDLILSAATCLTVYTPERLKDNISWGAIRQGAEAILCEDMKAISLCFHVCVMIFQGPTSFTSAALQLSDNLYSSAMALGIKVQCFVSDSENSTTNIMKGCVEAVKRTRKLEIYPVMPDTPTVEENVLTKFPCINHLSAHAILSCGVSLTRFLSFSHEQQVEATQAFDVPPNSLMLFKGQYQSRNHISNRSATIPMGTTTALEHESTRRNYDSAFREHCVRRSADIQAAHADELNSENQGIRLRLPGMQTLYGANSPSTRLNGIKGQTVGTSYQGGATIETHSMVRRDDADIEPSPHKYAKFKRSYGLASDDVDSQLTSCSNQLVAEDHHSSFPFFPPASIISGEMNNQLEEDDEYTAPPLRQYEDQAPTASAHLGQQSCVATFSMPKSNGIQGYPRSAIDEWIRADKKERIPPTCSAGAAPTRKKRGYVMPQNNSSPSQTNYKPRSVSHYVSPDITPSKVRAVLNPSGLDLFRHDTREADILAPKMLRQTKLPFAQFSPSPHKRRVQSASPMRSWTPMDKRAKEVLTYQKMGHETQSHLIWGEPGSGIPKKAKRTMVGSVSSHFY